MTLTPTTPDPGSKEAREQGCLCPVIDNHYGAGFMGGAKDEHGKTVFVINGECPLHGKVILEDG